MAKPTRLPVKEETRLLNKRTKIFVYISTGPETKNDCAVEDQQ
jgi:hypothetical protein